MIHIRSTDSSEGMRHTALIAIPDAELEEVVSSAIASCGIEVWPASSHEVKSTAISIKPNVIAMDISSLDVAELVEELRDIQGSSYLFFSNKFLSLNDRIALSQLQSLKIYPSTVSYLQIVNDLRFIQNVNTHVSLRIAVLDDSATESFLTADVLRKKGHSVSVFNDPFSALEAIEHDIPDMVIVDLYMPEMNGDRFVSILRQDGRLTGIPVIFLSGEIDEKVKLAATSCGADDFFSKPIDDQLFPERVFQIIKRSHQLRDVMDRDSLTGLLNHSSIVRAMDTHILADRCTTSFVMIDVDFFKKVNDTHGHQCGDMVLKSLSALLSRTIRSGDLAGRFGGEEFVLVLPGVNEKAASLIVNRIRELFTRIKYPTKDGNFTCSFSAGISLLSHECGVMEAIRLADERLYKAKGAGRNQVVYD